MSRENKIRQAGRTRRNSIRNGKNGFTMVELVVVLVVIALLAAVTIPVMFGFIDSAREKEYVVDAEAALTATQAALTEIYNDGGNRLIPDRRLKAKETAGAEDGSEFTVWTKGQLVDGKTAAIEDNMASYTVAYAKYVAADGKVVIFSDDEWTLYDNESAAKAGDSPALNSEGNVTGSTSGNVILVWGWENRYAGLSGRELSAKLDTAYAPDTEFNGRQEWNPDDEVPSVITVVFKVLQNEEETDKPLVCLLDGEDTLLNYTQLDENGKTFYTFTCLYDMDEGFNADFNKINKVKIAKKYESKFKWKYNQGGINIEADGEFKNLESQIKDSAAAIIGSQENPEIVLTAEMNPRQLPVTALFTALHDYSLSVEVRDSYTNSVNYTVGLSDDNTITGVNLAELITVKSAATGDTNNSVAQHDGLWREKISNNSMADGSSLASVDMRIRQYLLECKQDFMSSNRPSYMTDSEVAQITSQYKIEFKAAADIYKSVYIEQRMRNEAGIYTYNPPAQLVFFNDCAPEVPPLGKDNQYVVTFKKNELSDNVLFANGAAISESYSFKAASIDFDNIKGNIRRWDLSKCNKFGSIASIGSKPEIEDMYGDPTQKVLAKLTDLYKKCSSKDNVGDSLWLEVEMSSKSTAALAYNYYDTSNNWRNKPALAKTRMAGLVDNINKVIRVEYIKKDQRQQYGYYTEGMFYKEVLLSDTELETTATSAGDRLIPENGRIDEENIVRGDGLASDNKVTPPDENDEGACLDYVVAFSVRNGNNYNIYVFSENDSDTIVVRNSLQEMFSGYSSMTYNDFVSSLDTSEAYRLKKMFLNCSSLTELNLGNLNLYNTRDVSEIFHNCSKLETLYYNSDTFNTSNTWYFDQMFAGCAKLNPAPEIDISSAVDIHLMFTGCKSLKKVVIKAESIYNFEGALAGTYLGRENKNDAPNLSGMIGNKAISGVFSDCNGLEEIEILGPKPEDDKRLSFINITDLTYMFRSGYTYKDNNNNTRVNRFQNVKKVTIKNIGIPNMTSTDELFKDYISLGSISIEDFYAPKTVSMN
ncbi:MAG: BspA family leucine-rich repeat surface protein, partial [Eubacterium sp.]|nr:BspA family leucine-rich repeat surface protein [Eubacterium sp.]